MQFIDLDELEPKITHLLAGLAEARDAVMSEPDPARRAALINRYRPRWVTLRPFLEELSNQKCWYSECRNPGTDDDVDHFRPKLGVEEDPNHPGYYWLAFDWENLRLSCHRANRPRTNPETGETGGKAGHFPLINPERRAFGPCDNWQGENPAILDPTNPMDPPLLSFKVNGEVDLSPQFKGQPIPEEKFEKSRLYLHLNWPAFVEDRLMLYNRVKRLIARGQREAPEDRTSAYAPAFEDVIRDLVRMRRRRSEYSAAAHVYIEYFKHIWWVELIVLRVAE
jgi:uncharacterized protein (TIGR02646 family)